MSETDVFGSWLTRRRKALRLSRAALAQRIGCAVVTLQKIELGERRPSEQLAARLADQLQILASERTIFIRVARGELPLGHLFRPTVYPPISAIPALPRLIGREADQQAITILLAGAVHLLTLTGPGGVGKTRLATQLAHNLRSRYADGIKIVDLTPLTQADQVIPTIARSFGVAELKGVEPIDRLIAALRSRQLLLVLDNFEHVLDAAFAIQTLVRAVPRLTVLVTSRTVLRLSEEQQYAVPPLVLPHPPNPQRDYASESAVRQSRQLPNGMHMPMVHQNQVRDSVKSILDSPAVQLFVARMQAAQPNFTLTSANASAVAAICRRLDGLPLAIELAAARCKLFRPDDLLKRLDHALDILAHGARDLPNRHQTLRATLDWSYRLLAPPEQRLFRRLAVFVGGWTLTSAEVVCAEYGESELSMLNIMQALLDQSLVRQIDGESGTLRFGMLETIREYALECLAEAGESAAIRSRHAAWAVNLAESMDRIFSLQWREDYIDTLTCEYGNLRAALIGHLTESADPDPGLRLSGALWWFWAWRAYHSEARRWLSHFIRHSTQISLGRAKAMLCAGDLFGSQGEHLDGIAATDLLDASLACFREIRDAQGIAITLLTRGRIAWFQGDYHGAERYLTESLELCRSQSNHWGVAWSLISLGNTLLDLGDAKQAAACFGESLLCSQQWGYPEFSSYAVHNLGRVAHVQGDQQRAVECYLKARPWFRECGTIQGIGESLLDHGRILHVQGEDRQALALYHESYHYANQIGSPRSIAMWIESVAGVAATQRQPQIAARLFGAAEAIRAAIQIVHTIYERVDVERDRTIVQSQLEPAIVAAAWAAGQALTIEQAVVEAHECVLMISGDTVSHIPHGDQRIR